MQQRSSAIEKKHGSGQKKSHNRGKSQSVGVKGHEHIPSKQEMDNYMKPLEYNGQQVNNISDLQKIIDNEFDAGKMLNKDTYKSKVQEQFGEGNKPFFDEKFMDLITRIKPAVNYYQMRFGDKFLFLRRVHKLNYDIVEEEELRR